MLEHHGIQGKVTISLKDYNQLIQKADIVGETIDLVKLVNEKVHSRMGMKELDEVQKKTWAIMKHYPGVFK